MWRIPKKAGCAPVGFGLLGDFAFEPLDAGGLEVARFLEPFGMLWIHMGINRKAGRDRAFASMKPSGSTHWRDDNDH
jgi:hypothetical protein